MPLNVVKKEIEAERRVGYKYMQMLTRAESLVPGAGREAIEVLLWDANAALIRCDVQNDRVVMDGTLSCQAVYRMGEEISLRALSAKSSISQVAELAGAEPGMLCRAEANVESVEARYENGHMVFQVGLGIRVWVMELKDFEAVTELGGEENLRTKTQEICLTKLSAEASETAVLTGKIELPRTLDARTTLMDWGSVQIESVEPDLGGIRVKGRTIVETLIASGIEGKPAMVVKYPIEFDKLIELPEWLAKDAQVRASLRGIRTQVEQALDEEDAMLQIQADVYFDIAANIRECAELLADAYAVSGRKLELDMESLRACIRVNRTQTSETIRGTVMLSEGDANIGSIIAVRVLPNIAEISESNGRSVVGGLFDVVLLYMPAGSDRAACARAVLEFSAAVPQALDEESLIALEVASAEASALMGDRVDMKIGLNVLCETRVQSEIEYIEDAREGEAIARKPGYVVCWPEEGADVWSVAKRYGVAAESISGGERIESGRPLVLRI